MNFLIIHGMGGDHTDHWYPWLKEKLEADGHNVINETFPNNLKVKSDVSMAFAYNLLDDVDLEDLIIITHSSSCAVAFKIAEKNKIYGMIIVGGLFEDLGYQEEIDSELFAAGFDWDSIRKNTKFRIQIDSDNDPYMSNEHFAELSEKLNSEHMKFSGRKHFGHPDDSPERFPELLSKVKEILISS